MHNYLNGLKIMHVTSLGNLTATFINWEKKIIATFTLAPTRVHVHFFLSERASVRAIVVCSTEFMAKRN